MKGGMPNETESVPDVTADLYRGVLVWLADLRASALQGDHRTRGAQELRRHRDCACARSVCCPAACAGAFTSSQADAALGARTNPPGAPGTTATVGDRTRELRDPSL